MALDPGTRLGPYEILAPLGAGGMGEVYRARDTRLDRLVAVKVLPGDSTSAHALERFEREAKAIAALNHPGICAIYDVGTSPVPFLVMELLDGETLHQRLSRGPMDAPTLVDTGLALADALSAAHAKGILHRDLKPANIALTPRGPKILDFGLARATESVSVESGATAFETLAVQSPLTDVGVAVGTASYMSPEQLRGESLDARTDLFSLGLVLYEMATGRRAFSGATSAVTTAAILHDDPAAPRQLRPDVPARLEQAILTLLEKDRDVRTQTASELRAELTRIKRELGSARSNVERGPQTAPSSDMPAAVPATVSMPAAIAPAPASSSDAQIIAGVMGRHRGAMIAVAALVLVIVIGAAYVATRPGAETVTGVARSMPSIADLKVEQLTTSGTAGTPAISPDGNYVAYVETGPKGESLRVRQVATASNVEILPPEPGIGLYAPAVTPDGTFVDYLKRVGPQRFELWQIPFLGGSPRQLLAGIGSGVAFSPDGKRMAYVHDSQGQTAVMIAAADGSAAQALATRQTTSSAFLTIPGTGGLGWFAPAWSPDGTTVAVLGGRFGFKGQVVFIDVKTGTEKTVVEIGPPLPGISLAWLDAGTLILSLLDRSSAPLQLWLLSYPKGEFSRLTNDPNQYVGLSLTADRSRLVTARSEATSSIWTNDSSGKWTQTVPATPQKGPIGFDVAWLGDDLIFPSMASGSWTLERWHASTGTTETIAGAGGNPQVSPDGSIVFFDYDSGEMLKMDAAGRNKTQLARGRFNLRITPDGQQVTYVDAASGTPAVFIRPIAGASEAREIIRNGVRAGGNALVSPDGRRIAYGSFDDQKRPSTTVCDFPGCASPRTFSIAGVKWMPDSQGLAYVPAGVDIWVQPLDGGPARQLTHFPADGQQIWGAGWSADGKRLAVGRASIKNNIILFRGLKK